MRCHSKIQKNSMERSFVATMYYTISVFYRDDAAVFLYIDPLNAYHLIYRHKCQNLEYDIFSLRTDIWYAKIYRVALKSKSIKNHH